MARDVAARAASSSSVHSCDGSRSIATTACAVARSPSKASSPSTGGSLARYWRSISMNIALARSVAMASAPGLAPSISSRIHCISAQNRSITSRFSVLTTTTSGSAAISRPSEACSKCSRPQISSVVTATPMLVFLRTPLRYSLAIGELAWPTLMRPRVRCALPWGSSNMSPAFRRIVAWPGRSIRHSPCTTM